jgi:integrase
VWERENTLSSRTPVGEVGTSWVRPVISGGAEQWLAAVWVRDLDGRRRLVQARRPGRHEAELALEERLAQRRPLGFRGAEPDMTVQQLGEYWMRRRLEEARAPAAGCAAGGRRGVDDGVVSMQTLAGYQTVLSRIINPRLGGLRLSEVRTGVVDEVLARVDLSGRTTRVARTVLAQMFAMAVRHDALSSNPMREVRRSPRRRRTVQALSVEQARDLLELTRSHRNGVARDAAGLVLGGARRTSDLHDVVLLLLGTGMRIGEALALVWTDLDLDADTPCARVAATMVEPRRDATSGQVFVAELHRQPMTKTGAARTIALPCAAVEMLDRRRAGTMRQHHRAPVFAHAGGGWLWPNNVRTKLRGVVAGTPLVGVSPHTLRRTVGTLVAHGAGLDAARDVLGHRDPSVTARHYVADTGRVVDVRHTLDPIFV